MGQVITDDLTSVIACHPALSICEYFTNIVLLFTKKNQFKIAIFLKNSTFVLETFQPAIL